MISLTLDDEGLRDKFASHDAPKFVARGKLTFDEKAVLHRVVMTSWRDVNRESYLTESVYQVVLPKSIPAQIRQLIVHISKNKG